SPSGPITTTICAGSSEAAASSTCWIIGRPATGCRTFGKDERIRVPFPAASTTTTRGADMRFSSACSQGGQIGQRPPALLDTGQGLLQRQSYRQQLGL